MDRKPPIPTQPPRPAAPGRPESRGRSGRGSASALEAWKKVEQSRLPRDDGREPEVPSA